MSITVLDWLLLTLMLFAGCAVGVSILIVVAAIVLPLQTRNTAEKQILPPVS